MSEAPKPLLIPAHRQRRFLQRERRSAETSSQPSLAPLLRLSPAEARSGMTAEADVMTSRDPKSWPERSWIAFISWM